MRPGAGVKQRGPRCSHVVPLSGRVPRRNRETEMVALGDGGGFVRLYEVRINPLVREA